MLPYVIGIDIGTGSVKAVAVDASGKVLASAQESNELISTQPGYAEQDAEIIWEHFVSCIKKITGTLQCSPDLVSLSSYMHGIMAVDKECVPLTRLITWVDTRSENIAVTLRESSDSEELYQETGAPLHAMLPLCKLIWLHKNDPSVHQKAFKFISIKEYIWFRLFNVFEIDYSIAGATGLFNLHNKNWHHQSLELCSINAERLSLPVATHLLRKNPKGSSAASLGLNKEVSFCIGSSDGCLAVIGSGALGFGNASLTIGTSGAVRMLSTRPLFHYPEMLFSYILEDNLFVCGGPVNNGGNIVQWLLKNFWDVRSVSAEDYNMLFTRIKEIKAGSEGLLFLPYLNGERAIIWDEKASGVFTGLRQQHTKAHMSKAVLEGICLGLNMVIELIDQSLPVNQINVSGGFTNAPEWLQLLADISGKQLCLMHTEDASALGAAFMGMKSIGWTDNYDMAANIKSSFIQPDPVNKDTYTALFAVFKEVTRMMKDSFHSLYNIAKQ